MRIHKVVARFRDGRLVRGMTEDFEESGHRFTITDGPDGQQRIIVDKRLLKAVFFVKDWWGDRYYDDSQELVERPLYGIPVEITFRDGEVMRGYTGSRERTGIGFFFIPADPDSNNAQVYALYGAIDDLRFL